MSADVSAVRRSLFPVYETGPQMRSSDTFADAVRRPASTLMFYICHAPFQRINFRVLWGKNEIHFSCTPEAVI